MIRNELIALHRAHISEPEFYMQCVNTEVTGSGTDGFSGSDVVASEIYSKSDSQIFSFSVMTAVRLLGKLPDHLCVPVQIPPTVPRQRVHPVRGGEPVG